jgi:hypothetical protein
MPDKLESLTPAAPAQPLTTRKRATADVIHADLNERIDRLASREPKFRGCSATLPKPLTVIRADAPNWTVAGFVGLPSGGFTAVVKIVDQVRLEYELVA